MFAAFSNGAWTNEAWTAALVNHLWHSTVVVLMAWFLTLILRNNHAGARYWVWMIASVKFVIPFALLIAIGEWLGTGVATPIQRRPRKLRLPDHDPRPSNTEDQLLARSDSGCSLATLVTGLPAPHPETDPVG